MTAPGTAVVARSGWWIGQLALVWWSMSGMRSFKRWRWLVANRVAHRAWNWLQRSGAINAETAAGRRFASFGAGSLIAFPTGSVFGERWIVVGKDTMIGEQASICAGMMPGHDLGPEPVLRIGDRCVIGRGSHIVAHQSIDIGDDVYTGPYVYITDQNHSYADPDVPIGRQWPVNAAVRIGPGSWLGTGVIVLPGSVIGRNVVVAAGSVVRGEIADHCVVAGAPARVVRDFMPGTGWVRPGTVGPAEPEVARAAEPEVARPASLAHAHREPTDSPAGPGLTDREPAAASLGPADLAAARLTAPLSADPSGGDPPGGDPPGGDPPGGRSLGGQVLGGQAPGGQALGDPVAAESADPALSDR